MSEFQTSLVLIGALVIVAVFAYNKWQEYRAGRAVDETFRSRHPDVLIGAETGTGLQPGGNEESHIEPDFASRLPVAEARGPEQSADQPLPDPRIDYVIELEAQEPVSVAALQEGWASVEHRFALRAGLAAATGGEWGPPHVGGSWRKARAALQLVSRKGVVSESELLEFRSEVETLAAKLRALAVCPEMRDALEAARALDEICAAADIQVAFHVVAAPGAAFAGTKLRAAAEASGFELDRSGRFTLADESGREVYALADRSGGRFDAGTMKDAAPQALTLSMDVPRAPETQRTFDAMVRFGRHLANLLGGGLVDDNNQPLDERAVSAINAQLAMVRQNLEAHGISPGSALALRLFS
jgi:hypothetical protein